MILNLNRQWKKILYNFLKATDLPDNLKAGQNNIIAPLPYNIPRYILKQRVSRRGLDDENLFLKSSKIEYENFSYLSTAWAHMQSQEVYLYLYSNEK